MSQRENTQTLGAACFKPSAAQSDSELATSVTPGEGTMVTFLEKYCSLVHNAVEKAQIQAEVLEFNLHGLQPGLELSYPYH